MINEAQEWGDFSEWLNCIHDCIEREQVGPVSVNDESGRESAAAGHFLKALHRWVQQVEAAPVTTWSDELSVRGMDFEYTSSMADATVTRQLWQLLHALANMQVTLTNTDHLSERELYRLLIEEILVQPIAQLSGGSERGSVVDVVGIATQDDPTPWLQYYASNRERMEWAKQNPGKGLPVPMSTPHARDALLPKG